MQVLASGMSSALLVRAACALLRQLANSDAIKAEIVEQQGLSLFCKAVDAHIHHAGMPHTPVHSSAHRQRSCGWQPYTVWHI